MVMLITDACFSTTQADWLQGFSQKAQEALTHSQPSQESQSNTELPVSHNDVLFLYTRLN